MELADKPGRREHMMILKSKAVQRHGEFTQIDESIRELFSHEEEDMTADPVTIKFMAERVVNQSWED
eukprot:8245712-Prorocentrum_lima.AAC.1